MLVLGGTIGSCRVRTGTEHVPEFIDPSDAVLRLSAALVLSVTGKRQGETNTCSLQSHEPTSNNRNRRSSGSAFLAKSDITSRLTHTVHVARLLAARDSACAVFVSTCTLADGGRRRITHPGPLYSSRSPSRLYTPHHAQSGVLHCFRAVGVRCATAGTGATAPRAGASSGLTPARPSTAQHATTRHGPTPTQRGPVRHSQAQHALAHEHSTALCGAFPYTGESWDDTNLHRLQTRPDQRRVTQRHTSSLQHVVHIVTLV